MRNLIVLLFLLLSVFAAAEDDLLKVRNLYYRASGDQEASDSFCSYLNSTPAIPKYLLDGYIGMSYMIKAKHSWNPYNKLSFFNKGKDYLDNAITKDPKNIELRFLRFCVQTNAPGFLNYRGAVTEDKAVISVGYNILKDKDLKDRIKNYMLGSSSCTDKEKTIFK